MATKCLLAVLRLHLTQTLLFLILCGSSLLFVLSNSLWDIRNGLLTFYRYSPETEEMARLEDFRRDWLRQRRARVDWQEILRPCHDNTAWGQVKNGWGKLNRSNAITSDIIFKDIRPAGEFSKIFIQSRTSDNRTKTIGGDSWRVYVRGSSSVVVTVFDHSNGTYEALFLITEPGVYRVIIYLDYSLCDAFKDPPRDWFIKGNVQGKFQKNGLLGILDDWLMQPLKNGIPLKINVTQARMNTSFTSKFSSEVPFSFITDRLFPLRKRITESTVTIVIRIEENTCRCPSSTRALSPLKSK